MEPAAIRRQLDNLGRWETLVANTLGMLPWLLYRRLRRGTEHWEVLVARTVEALPWLLYRRLRRRTEAACALLHALGPAPAHRGRYFTAVGPAREPQVGPPPGLSIERSASSQPSRPSAACGDPSGWMREVRDKVPWLRRGSDVAAPRPSASRGGPSGW